MFIKLNVRKLYCLENNILNPHFGKKSYSPIDLIGCRYVLYTKNNYLGFTEKLRSVFRQAQYNTSELQSRALRRCPAVTVSLPKYGHF